MDRALPTPAGRRAFTLVELLVVIVLITVLSALLVPEMRGTFEEALLRSSARQLIGASGVAYSRAVADGRAHRLHFDPATGRYRVERRADPATGPDRTDRAANQDVPGGRGVIDPRIAVQLRHPAGDGDDGGGRAPAPADRPAEGTAKEAMVGVDGVGGVDFFPDGTAQAAEFILRDRAGFRLALRVNPVTARLQVRELTER